MRAGVAHRGRSNALSSKNTLHMPGSLRLFGMRRHENQARENRHASAGATIKLHDEEDFARLLEGQPSPLVLILDCIQDPHNLGACLRTADAAGCALVVLPKDRTAPSAPSSASGSRPRHCSRTS